MILASGTYLGFLYGVFVVHWLCARRPRLRLAVVAAASELTLQPGESRTASVALTVTTGSTG